MRRSIFIGLAVLAAHLMAISSSQAQGRPWGEGYFPNLPVVNQHGEKLRFYDDVIKGKIVVISFIYTSCTEICPLSTARLAQVAEQFGDRLGRDIFFISLSVDPNRDTPEKLKAYADSFRTGPGWVFLTGSLQDMRAINARLGERMRSLNEHRNEIVLGNDATGEWARNSLFGDMKRVVMDIQSMDPKWRNEVRTVAVDAASDTGHLLSAQPGQVLFKKLCSSCHMFKVGNRVGPDLYGVTSRRSNEWLMRFIMNPERVRRQQDPTALALVGKFPGVRMPTLGLTEIDATDLISYLDSQSKWLDAQRREAAQTVPASHNHDHNTHKH
jgi:protein SCO1